MLNPELLNQLGPLVFKTVAGLVISGLLGVIVWPVRKAKKEWITLKETLDAVHLELSTQRSNCLATLQSQGAEQIVLLGKTVEVLGGVRLDLAEQTGYLMGGTIQPVRRRRATKKKK